MKKDHTYYTYILSNPARTTLYIGVTKNLSRRLKEHFENRGNVKYFSGRYYCYELVYYEIYQYVNDAIAREKQLKKWNRSKKNTLIKSTNPKLLSLNPEFIHVEE